jgi:hypothetical protein
MLQAFGVNFGAGFLELFGFLFHSNFQRTPRKTMGFYIGYSTDLKRRLSEHTRGASFATKIWRNACEVRA